MKRRKEKECQQCGKIFNPKTCEKICCEECKVLYYTRQCKYCKGLFVDYNQRQEFCSRDCARQSTKLPSKACKHCNTEFQPTHKRIMYCSTECYNEHTRIHKNETIRNRTYHLRKSYGMTLSDYETMYSEQNGCCAICGNEFDKLFIDHCHDSNNVRGLLCDLCNRGLGYFKDNIYTLSKAIQYLEENK